MRRIEEERIQVLNNMDELELKIKDLDNQMEESIREVGQRGGDIMEGGISWERDVITCLCGRAHVEEWSETDADHS